MDNELLELFEALRDDIKSGYETAISGEGWVFQKHSWESMLWVLDQIQREITG